MTNKPPKIRVLVTHFGPFDGRKVNASGLAAKGIRGRKNALVKHIEVPVIWGASPKAINSVCREFAPDIIISFGEAKSDYFRLESRARNRRLPREDTLAQLPKTPKIDPRAPNDYYSQNNNKLLSQRLNTLGFYTKISKDTGGYICEEMFYSIERAKRKFKIGQVIFAHVPHLNLSAEVSGENVIYSEEILRDFGKALANLLIAEHKQAPRSKNL